MSAPPIPSAPADLELIAQLKSRLQYAELRIQVLEERLRLMRIEKYGAGGEKLCHAQMELFALGLLVKQRMPWRGANGSTAGRAQGPAHETGCGLVSR